MRFSSFKAGRNDWEGSNAVYIGAGLLVVILIIILLVWLL